MSLPSDSMRSGGPFVVSFRLSGWLLISAIVVFLLVSAFVPSSYPPQVLLSCCLLSLPRSIYRLPRCPIRSLVEFALCLLAPSFLPCDSSVSASSSLSQYRSKQ